MLHYNHFIEYRFDMLSRILADSYIGLRYDVAGCWDDPEPAISRDDWLRSVSFYFALDTFLGPFIIQYGHLFEYGSADEQNIIYVRFGNLF